VREPLKRLWKNLTLDLGHLEGASGILAVIKCVLMLEKRILLPNANFERSNPAFDLECHNLKVRDPETGQQHVSLDSSRVVEIIIA
jgi:3-oxoacyl-(acyl-carrier-protein) synthase